MKRIKKYFQNKKVSTKVLFRAAAMGLVITMCGSIPVNAAPALKHDYGIETYVLVGESIADAKVSTIEDQVYTGESLTPSVTVKVGSTILKKGSDYLVYYTNNKSIGKATVTIAGLGNYKGNVTASFNIVPKKVSVKTPTSKKQGTATLTWEKCSSVSGYEISYGTTSTGSFKVSGTTKELTYTIAQLTSGKTYYVRVRVYKTVDSKKYYGKYSTVRSIKVM